MPENTSPVMPEMLAGVCDVNARPRNVHNEHGRRLFIVALRGLAESEKAPWPATWPRR